MIRINLTSQIYNPVLYILVANLLGAEHSTLLLSRTGLWSVHDKVNLKKIMKGKPKDRTPQGTQQTNKSTQTQQLTHKIENHVFRAPEIQNPEKRAC